MMSSGSSFGDWLRRRRRALDLTQVALAQRVGCAPITIRKFEADELLPSRQIAVLLAEHLGIPAAERDAFIEFARGRAGDGQSMPFLTLPDPAAPTAPSNNLPLQLTNFIGRAREQSELIQLLSSARLVTLTGAGGSGKTRLALRVAEDLSAQFANGIWFIDLAPLTDPAQVTQTAMTVFGVREDSNRPPIQTLVQSLRGKKFLTLFPKQVPKVKKILVIQRAFL